MWGKSLYASFAYEEDEMTFSASGALWAKAEIFHEIEIALCAWNWSIGASFDLGQLMFESTSFSFCI
jgi:hypothetical protein